jgi:hypothetical protein
VFVGPESRESLDLPRPQIHSDEPVRPLSILYGDGGEPIGRHGRLIQPRPLSDAALPPLPVNVDEIQAPAIGADELELRR